jgi:hypothetical protein
MNHPITLRKYREMMMVLITPNKKIKLRKCFFYPEGESSQGSAGS